MTSYITGSGTVSPYTVAEFCAGIIGIIMFWRKNDEVELREPLNDAGGVHPTSVKALLRVQLRDEILALKEQARSRESELKAFELVKEELKKASTDLGIARESARSAEESRMLMEVEMKSRLEDLRILNELVRELEEVKSASDAFREAVAAKVEGMERQKHLLEEELEKKTKEADNKALEVEEVEALLRTMKEEMKAKDEKIALLEKARPSSHRGSIESLRTGHSGSSGHTSHSHDGILKTLKDKVKHFVLLDGHEHGHGGKSEHKLFVDAH